MSEASSSADSLSPDFDLDWRYTVHLEDSSHDFWLRSKLQYIDNPTIDTLVLALITSDILPDSRATWHHNYTPLQCWVDAHILRFARDLTIEGTAEYLQDNPKIAEALGFYEGEPLQHPAPPGYTQLHDIWEDEFSDRLQASCVILAEKLVELARDHGIPAPDDVFVPEPDVEVAEEDEDDPTVRELTIEKTADIWEHARPMVLNRWELKRHHNFQIPEAKFFDAHAGLAASSDDVFPESGLGNMQATGALEQAHYPSTHRRELKRFTIDEIRELHRSVTEDLIREARREGELVGEVTVAIDQTKGHPWTGEIKRNEDGESVEQWILGYKNDNDQRAQYYFQWASVQIVGMDIPLVLDAIPVRRGMTKGEIVDELLSTATDLVDDIDVVMMDAGFDSEAVKNRAERNDVTYLNRKSRNADDKEVMREMWEERDHVRIVEEEDRIGMHSRKKVYVPKVVVDYEEDDEPEEDGDDGDDRNEVRQEILEDFAEVVPADMDEESPLDDLMEDIHAENTADEAPEEDDDEDEEDEFDPSEMYVVFETNDPSVGTGERRGQEPISKRERRQAAARLVRWYGLRWGIENGYKKIKHFLPRSGSKDPVLRFFGFAFAATLYNCWRLVDILVKLSVEDDPVYTPLVTASRFISVVQGMFGLKPPPD